MKFSILIANYNNESFFSDCYNSIINQTYQNFEVIIVDDCSTDNSLKLIQTLISGDDRFKLYKNEYNSGVGYTKKKCADLANGEICGFLDPDDALKANAIEYIIQTYIKHPKYIAVYSQLYICDANLNPKNVFNRSKQIINGDKYFFNIENSVSHFFTYKRFFYKNLNLNPKMTKSVDQDLYLNLYEQGSFFFLAQPLYYYRIHQKGISQGKDKKEELLTQYGEILLATLKRRNINEIGRTKLVNINKNNIYTIICEYQSRLIYRLKNRILIFFHTLRPLHNNLFKSTSYFWSIFLSFPVFCLVF